MPQLIDRVGQRFERLLVLKYAGQQRWHCLCQCGNKTTVHISSLKHSRSPTKSCGCWRREFIRPTQTHGQSFSRTHNIWCAIKRRCNNKNAVNYGDYGGRGITYCERWEKFENFFADMGESPRGKSIERKNNEGNYEPRNCKWATRKEQGANKRNNRYLEFNGQNLTIAEWTRKTKLPKDRIWNRHYVLRWSVEKTLTTPARKGNYRKIKQLCMKSPHIL